MTFRFACFAIALASWTTGSAAQDLTIRFTGKFVSSTCTFTVPEVELGTYAASTFTGSTQTPEKTVSITRSGCTPDIVVAHMKFTGTPDSVNSQYFAAKSTNGAAGVGISIRNGSNVQLQNNTSIDWQLPVIGNVYNVYARLSQTGPVKPGAIKTPITIQFTYN